MSDLFVVTKPVKDLLLSDSRVLSLIYLGKGVCFGWLVGWLVLGFLNLCRVCDTPTLGVAFKYQIDV